MGNTTTSKTTTDQKEQDMPISDIGPDPQSFDLEQQTVENPNYRTVVWSGKYLQLTLMSIPEVMTSDSRCIPRPTSSSDWTLVAGGYRWDPARTIWTLIRRCPTDVASWCPRVPGTTSPTSETSRCRCMRSMRLPTTSPARYRRPRPTRPATTMTNLPAGLYSRHQQPTSMDEGCPLRIHPARVMPGLRGESRMGSSPSLSPYLYSKRRT